MSGVHDGMRVFLRGSGPEVHRAQTKSRDSKASAAEIGKSIQAAFHLRAGGVDVGQGGTVAAQNTREICCSIGRMGGSFTPSSYS